MRAMGTIKVVGSLLTNVNNKGKDSNTTHAAVSEGEIILRDKANQKQDIPLLRWQNLLKHHKYTQWLSLQTHNMNKLI
ncbi:hypothetical protein AB6F62_22070 [Providencia huaxiensis]|nr:MULTISPECIES: hypothetical protein [unclassified Providencia]APC10570.1 hypothetical protein RB151_008650 [Providencia rettgeri]ELR5032486.1 hypothetical protein [Providencia rettgeri]ELR5134753.1 hypothetical protein [Providencia rettgeri]ELR5226403.1 hypothetical protein [Providencia rettgeri]ELR5252831.1 hypothetical protein [Providencia rettgeri]